MTTKLERQNPNLTALAELVYPGWKIHYRAKAYWLQDVQLTYDYEGSRRLDFAGQADLAERILKACLDARVQPAWGDTWARQRRILIGLREDTMPAYRPGHFCHFRHPSLDDGCLFAGGFGAATRCTAWVHLVNGPNDSAESRTLEGALDALWAKLAPAGERPAWWGREPVTLTLVTERKGP